MNMQESDGSSGVYCNACAHNMEDFQARFTHYKTEWHRYNVKRRCAGLPPITMEAFQMKVSELQRLKAESNASYSCNLCRKGFASPVALDQHLNSKKHKKKESQFQANPEKFLSSLAQAGQNDEQNENDVDADVEGNEDAQVDGEPSFRLSAEAVPREVKVNDSANEVKDGDMDGVASNANDDAEGNDEQGIPVLTCLFCLKQFDQLQPSLDHMLKQHGFFIPFIEYLSDIEGLLRYCGEKIGIGHMCLYCNGRGRISYPSLRAVQQHMTDKSHCKIRLEDEEDEDEFLEFYSFPHQEEEREDDSTSGHPAKMQTQQDANSTSTKKDQVPRGLRHASSIADDGELVLSDGTRLGHRSLVTYYRQQPKPQNANAQLINELMNQYHSMKLTGYQEKTKSVKRDKEFSARLAAWMNKRQMDMSVKSNQLQRHFRRQMLV